MAMNAYKAVEKKWKQMKLKGEEELRTLLATSTAPNTLIDVKQGSSLVYKVGECEILPGRNRPIYALCDPKDSNHVHSGFFIIPGALDSSTQRSIAEKCLNEYAEAPHTTNLHPLNQQVEKIWLKSVESRTGYPKTKDPMEKLHWAALGYHYNWTMRAYPEHPASLVPGELQTLGRQCARAVGFDLISEAALVNYYKATSTMGGHQDNVEVTFNHPVVSFSLGCSAVFLKGGLSKDTTPMEILLRSGDVVIMGGGSRLCFHGIAKTLPVQQLEAFPLTDDDVGSWNVANYLRTNRLNINLRQVFPSKNHEATMVYFCNTIYGVKTTANQSVPSLDII
ncbi:Aste57867_24800 [Aphanomyces stellatus]|uniref:Aste57867_24800 protein n=1 Tax=Aphanomyces stellatus TaxID=120398 RepID=A0A485LRE1_9STRA|nr:hypothetical protein As57867_024722 [Aphanomyces stellatus]VFU01435.1 Aste57867_24800 [Aphanomyces stellatus]